jgi:hypothetical protein
MSVASVTPAPARADPAFNSPWRIKNYTAQNIWGQFQLQNGSNSSDINIPQTQPVPPGQTSTRKILPNDSGNNTYFQGRFCYLGSWWNLKRGAYLDLPWIGSNDEIDIDVAFDGLLYGNFFRYGASRANRVNMERTDATDRDPCPR